jgi:hypothetical protein
MPEPKCELCKWYGHKVPGCFHGGNPSRSDKCLHPHLFEAKQMTSSYELETPTEWHLTGYKPKEQPKPKLVKAKKTSPSRDSKGRFTKR